MKSLPSLFEFKVEIPQSTAEGADFTLLELGLEAWSVYEDVILKRAWIVGIAASEAEICSQWERINPALLAAAVVPFSPEPIRVLGEPEWRDSYKAHFKAWTFGRLHWIPEWERNKVLLPEGHVALLLDPGLAFGTGNHETTRLCCERLVALASRRPPAPLSVIDAGCGSGILALSAALLGFGHIKGFDNDPEAVRVSGENATLNQLEGRVQFFTGDLVSGLAGRQADLVLANILANILMDFSPQLIASVAPGGTLVLSGILAQERDQVLETFSSLATAWSIESATMGEWSDVVLTRPSN
jgi:ribosomal protein L11 methyltransferase